MDQAGNLLRPKGMHQVTYERLLDEFDSHNRKAWRHHPFARALHSGGRTF
jgi:hypothetical protein